MNNTTPPWARRARPAPSSRIGRPSDSAEELRRVRLKHVGTSAHGHVLTVTFGLHESRLHQLFQVMRNRRLRHREAIAEGLVRTAAIRPDRFEHREATRVGERFGDSLELPRKEAGG